jgi:hypothetical protein
MIKFKNYQDEIDKAAENTQYEMGEALDTKL